MVAFILPSPCSLYVKIAIKHKTRKTSMDAACNYMLIRVFCGNTVANFMTVVEIS